MAVFSGKQILYAVFTNNANDTIEVVYNHKDEGEPPEYISVWVPSTDPTNSELIGLKQEGWSFDKIQRETHNRLDQQKRAYEARINDAVKEQLEHYYKVVDTRYNEMIDAGPAITTTILQAVIDSNTDEDVIFKTKLAVFDLQQIKDLKDRALKQKIRTAKTLMELFGALQVALADK